jgi:GTP-binding protein
MKMSFLCPQEVVGYRNESFNGSRVEGVLTAVFEGYIPHKGKYAQGYRLAYRARNGEAVRRAFQRAGQARFTSDGKAVYAGWFVGMSPKPDDLVVNVCSASSLPTNALREATTRSTGASAQNSP